MKKKEIYLIINNVRSILNVGSIFRTADGAGVKKIFICGYTPTPETQQDKISKTALGAEKSMAWEYHKNAWRLVERLKESGISVVALEQDKKSEDIYKFKPKYPMALLVGSEVGGVGRAVLKRCQRVIEIPMRGQKESLNVAVATGVALYTLTNK